MLLLLLWWGGPTWAGGRKSGKGGGKIALGQSGWATGRGVERHVCMCAPCLLAESSRAHQKATGAVKQSSGCRGGAAWRSIPGRACVPEGRELVRVGKARGVGGLKGKEGSWHKRGRAFPRNEGE